MIRDMSVGCGCGECKRVREHVASLLPFRVVEAAGVPLRIAGVAMAAGISRNFNIYAPEELEAFAGKLVGAPVYIEHVTVETAAGKCTKAQYDSATRQVTYEAEIYDEAVAAKLRNGLIRHVSVGADYSAIDLVDAKIPRGLYNPELSLVAVPGVPETTIQVLEQLAHVHSSVPASGKDRKPVKVVHEQLSKFSGKELLQDLQCVFCGAPGEFLVSTCAHCGDRAAGLAEAAGAFLAGFDPAKGDGDFSCVVVLERVGGRFAVRSHSGNEGEKMEEKEVNDLAERLAAKLKVKEALMLKCPKCGAEFDAAQWAANGWKCPSAGCGVAVDPPVLALKGEPSAVEKLRVAEQTVLDQNKLLEKYRKVAPGVDLLVDPPVLMPVSEHLAVLEGLLPPAVVERSSMGMQRHGQSVRAAILKAKEKLERN